MRKFYLLAFVASALMTLTFLTVFSASAQSTATPSPTWDIRTPPYTPTQGGNAFSTVAPPNYNCPEGVPEGYGETVADPSWEAACGHCLPTPTIYPTFDPNLTMAALQCDSHMFGCFQVDSDTIYFTGGSAMLEDAYAQFYIENQSDIYLYYRPVNYRAFALIDETPYDGLITQGLTNFGPVSSSVYPAVDEDYVIDDVPPGAYGIRHEIEPPYLQDFGCSRIYVSLTPFTIPEWDCASIEIEPTLEPVNDGEITACFWEIEDGASCVIAEDGQSAHAIIDRTTSGALAFNLNHLHFDWDGDFPLYAIIDLFGVDGGDHSEAGFRELNVWEVFCDNEGSCDYDVIQEFAWHDSGGSVYMHVYPDGTVSGTVDLYINPPGSGVVATPTAGSVLPVITGSVCSVVQPLDLTPELEFNVITEYPGSCVLIPYVGFGDFLDGLFFGVLDLIAPDFVTFLNTWGNFPASTICWHYVDFATQYLLNVSIPLNLFAIAVVTLWFLRKLSSKGA